MSPAASRRETLPIDEIRARYVNGDRPVTAQLLARLRKDPRRGVRQLHDLLKRRFDKERAEQKRLDAMLHFERVLWRAGKLRVAGVDEVGMGPLAGPVVAAAVILPPDAPIAGVDDSKKLDPSTRARLADEIRTRAVACAIGTAEVGEIDALNIYRAGLLAMRRALEALPVAPEHVLVDARTIPDVPWPQNAFQKGDGIDYSVAAASIVAKVHRDALMERLDREWPEYGFARHKGYGTAEHQEAIRRHGPCPIHRMSFTFIRELCGEYSAPFYALKERLAAAADGAALRAFEEALAAAALPEVEERKLRVMLGRRWATLG